jgi:hypothetical protein
VFSETKLPVCGVLANDILQNASIF